MSAPPGKVLGEDSLAAAVLAHRKAGRRVVFTNGAFDLLHVGHVRMLDAARRLGDVLVVAVNDDASVRAAKGAGRPVAPEAERAEVVAALEAVTHVVVFPDATVDRLLRRLRPDVHAKGRDYTDETLPERATDRTLGIQTAFVGDEKTHSSTSLAGALAGSPYGSLGQGPDGLAGERAGPRPRAGDRVVDKVVDVLVPRSRAVALERRRPLLESHGFLDLDSLVQGRDGVEVNRHAMRTVRRLEVEGRVVYLKVERARKRPFRKPKARSLEEFRNHVALRAAGFRAPEPWLAVEGRTADGGRAAALLTEEAGGTPLDRFLADRFERARGRARAAWARGIGSAVRALHTARFLHPDLLAYHLVVDPDPAGGASTIAFLDLARVKRAPARVLPTAAAPGLAALTLSLRPLTDERFRLGILRAYLGGGLADARPWLRAIEKRIGRVRDRGTFRRLAKARA